MRTLEYITGPKFILLILDLDFIYILYQEFGPYMSTARNCVCVDGGTLFEKFKLPLCIPCVANVMENIFLEVRFRVVKYTPK